MGTRRADVYDARERAEWGVYERLADRRAVAATMRNLALPEALDLDGLERGGSTAVRFARQQHAVEAHCIEAFAAFVAADEAARAHAEQP